MLVTALGAAFALAVIGVALLRRGGDKEAAAHNQEVFDAAIAQETSTIGKLMLRAAKPLAGSPYTNISTESPAYQALRLRLAAAGDVYSGSPVVYLSVQIFAGLIASIIMIFLFIYVQSGLMLLMGALVAVALGYYPWQRIAERARKRADAIDRDLPEFAELLLMPLSGGYGILPALDFTANRSKGPVAQEVRTLLTVINSSSGSDADAFQAAGDRLGTPSARAFFTSLAQAYIDGTAVVESLRGQAEQLRKISYERIREKIKILPNKLVLIIGLHLMPALFVVVLLPIMATWSTAV